MHKFCDSVCICQYIEINSFHLSFECWKNVFPLPSKNKLCKSRLSSELYVLKYISHATTISFFITVSNVIHWWTVNCQQCLSMSSAASFHRAHQLLVFYWPVLDWEGLPGGTQAGRGWLGMFQPQLDRLFLLLWRESLCSVTLLDRVRDKSWSLCQHPHKLTFLKLEDYCRFSIRDRTSLVLRVSWGERER